ncbi:hypothetical protein HRbin04_00359 [archaeon HR04]|nr:hypothetical protein HRbin04_00359 [archaeon HR04]
MVDNAGLRTTGIVTGLALLLLLLLQPYSGNYNQPIVEENTVKQGDDGNGSNDDGNNNNLLPHSSEGFNTEPNDDSNNTIQVVEDVEDGGGSAGNGGDGSGDDGSGIDTHTEYNGDAWLFIYPSNVSMVHLPIKCVALTTIDEVDYVECALYTPEGSEHARLTINTGSSPSYTPLPSGCNADCREFSAWFSHPNTPNTEGTWTVKAYFYSTNPGLITEREDNVKVYNGGGSGSGNGDLPNGGFMVVPEFMAGAIAMILASMAILAGYMLGLRPRMQ